MSEEQSSLTVEQPAEPTNEAELASLKPEEIENFARTGSRTGKKREQKSVEPPVAASGDAVAPEAQPAAVGEPQKQADGSVDIDLGDGRTLHFKNADEFRKSFIHAQQYITKQKGTIDSLNARMGEVSGYKAQLEQAQREIADLKRQIQRSAAPTAARQQASDGVASLQKDLNALQRQAAQPGQSLEVQQLIESQIAQIREELAGEVQQLKDAIALKEQQARAESTTNNVYREVDALQKADASYATKMPFSAIDDIVASANGDAEFVRTQVSPEDLAVYNKVWELLKLRYHTSIDDTGAERIHFDQPYANVKSLISAKRLLDVESGALEQQTATAVAAAQKNGQAAVVNALKAGAEAAKTLPSAAPAAQDEMSADMINNVLDDVQRNPYEYKINPAKKQLWQKVAAKVGIDPTMVG